MRASGHYSLFIVHFLYHCEPRPSLKGRGLPLTGNAKVKGHACSPLRTARLRQVFYLLVCHYRRETNALDVLCIYVEYLKVLYSFHVINNE